MLVFPQHAGTDFEENVSTLAPIWLNLQADQGKQETCWVPEHSAQLYQQGLNGLIQYVCPSLKYNLYQTYERVVSHI
jgi:hypothetical protein